MRTLLMTATTLGLLAMGLACGEDRVASDSNRDISNVNSSIQVADGEHAGNLHTVNGSISIGEHAIINSAQTVNGSVRLGADGRASSLTTVNGSVTIGKRSVVSGNVKTVNGRIELSDEAVVQGDAKNVNSEISIGQRAHVSGRVTTSTGDITLHENAKVDGGIHVEENNSWFGGLFDFFSRTPVVSIGAGAQVGGELIFDRDVVLRVHPTAKIGPVKGAKVQRTSSP